MVNFTSVDHIQRHVTKYPRDNLCSAQTGLAGQEMSLEVRRCLLLHFQSKTSMRGPWEVPA